MKQRDLDILLREGEGSMLEYKEGFSSSFARDLVAFANSSGGKILLGVRDEVKVVVPPQTDEEKILAHVREHRSIKRSECQQLLGVSGIQARYLLQKMRKRGLLRLDRRGRGARYILP